jgi:hypothetical protein
MINNYRRLINIALSGGKTQNLENQVRIANVLSLAYRVHIRRGTYIPGSPSPPPYVRDIIEFSCQVFNARL